MPRSSSLALLYQTPTISPACGTPYRLPSPNVLPSAVYDDTDRTDSGKRSSQPYDVGVPVELAQQAGLDEGAHVDAGVVGLDDVRRVVAGDREPQRLDEVVEGARDALDRDVGVLVLNAALSSLHLLVLAAADLLVPDGQGHVAERRRCRSRRRRARRCCSPPSLSAARGAARRGASQRRPAAAEARRVWRGPWRVMGHLSLRLPSACGWGSGGVGGWASELRSWRRPGTPRAGCPSGRRRRGMRSARPSGGRRVDGGAAATRRRPRPSRARPARRRSRGRTGPRTGWRSAAAAAAASPARVPTISAARNTSPAPVGSRPSTAHRRAPRPSRRSPRRSAKAPPLPGGHDGERHPGRAAP